MVSSALGTLLVEQLFFSFLFLEILSLYKISRYAVRECQILLISFVYNRPRNATQIPICIVY